MIREFAIVLASVIAVNEVHAAVFTTTLEPSTIDGWNAYIDRFEHSDWVRRPLVNAGELELTDLNPSGAGAPNGYIHHWMGVMRIPNTTVEKVRSVIADYGHWQQIYAPDVRLASATRDGNDYDLRMVSEQSDGLLHFAFDMHFRVHFEQVGDFVVAESRSYCIRESDSGHAPYTDLLPEGHDHGILWRLNTNWRLKQDGTATYAECQVISLSRKPVIGSTGHVKGRARDSLKSTMLATARAATRAKLY